MSTWTWIRDSASSTGFIESVIPQCPCQESNILIPESKSIEQKDEEFEDEPEKHVWLGLLFDWTNGSFYTIWKLFNLLTVASPLAFSPPNVRAEIDRKVDFWFFVSKDSMAECVKLHSR